MKELPFTGHKQDTSVVVTINHCYQYGSGKEGGTEESNKGRQAGRKKGKKEKKILIQMKMRVIRPQG